MSGGSLRSWDPALRALLLRRVCLYLCLRGGGCYLNHLENLFLTLPQKLSFFTLSMIEGVVVGYGVGMITTSGSMDGVTLGVNEGTTAELLGVGLAV